MNPRYREIVWDAFRNMNARAGHIVTMRDFKFGVLRQMNPVQQEEFIAELEEMTAEGLLIYEDGRTGLETLRLTQAGFSQLYHPRSDAQIANVLMDLFSKGNYRVGEIIPMRNINMQFIPNLNPMEQDRFEDVVNRLIDARFITYEDGTHKAIPGLILEQNGFDCIYRNNPSTSTVFP